MVTNILFWVLLASAFGITYGIQLLMEYLNNKNYFANKEICGVIVSSVTTILNIVLLTVFLTLCEYNFFYKYILLFLLIFFCLKKIWKIQQ